MNARITRWSALASKAGRQCLGLLPAFALSLAVAQSQPGALQPGSKQPPISSSVTVVQPSGIVPPRYLQPCAPGQCLFPGQRVTLLLPKSVVAMSFPEVKQEFEAATGATLNIVEVATVELFDNFFSDVAQQAGKYDAVLASAWWLGELVEGRHIVSYDGYMRDPRFPKWDIADVLPAPRTLLSYGGHKYMVANDHDGQVLYYRRDLLTDPQHRAEFRQRYGYELGVPLDWSQFRDIAQYFNGRDLNGDGVPDHGLVLPLKPGLQGMFHYMSLSAPFVIGPTNPKLYWFDPQSMKPLIESPGHVRALRVLVDLVQFGPRAMLGWDTGGSWDHFLAGRAALTFTWGDLGALAQQKGSRVRGRVGAAQMPGTTEYYSLAEARWVKAGALNRVGNTTGGSWAGVISRYSKAPEAVYFLFALMATKEKSMAYAARGSDGIDAGRTYHFLPPDGSADIGEYLRAGWHEADVRDYLHAYFENFSNKAQLPFLRIPGTYGYWQALNRYLAEAAAGQVTPEAALKSASVSFEEVTLRLGREAQRRAYRESLGF